MIREERGQRWKTDLFYEYLSTCTPITNPESFFHLHISPSYLQALLPRSFSASLTWCSHGEVRREGHETGEDRVLLSEVYLEQPPTIMIEEEGAGLSEVDMTVELAVELAIDTHGSRSYALPLQSGPAHLLWTLNNAQVHFSRCYAP